jgi:hypothetical protein
MYIMLILLGRSKCKKVIHTRIAFLVYTLFLFLHTQTKKNVIHYTYTNKKRSGGEVAVVRASLSRDFRDSKPDPAANIGRLWGDVVVQRRSGN